MDISSLITFFFYIYRGYYFQIEEVQKLFESIGFQTINCSYVQRRTVNLKENIDVPRIFVQAKFTKI